MPVNHTLKIICIHVYIHMWVHVFVCVCLFKEPGIINPPPLRCFLYLLEVFYSWAIFINKENFSGQFNFMQVSKAINTRQSNNDNYSKNEHRDLILISYVLFPLKRDRRELNHQVYSINQLSVITDTQVST